MSFPVSPKAATTEAIGSLAAIPLTQPFFYVLHSGTRWLRLPERLQDIFILMHRWSSSHAVLQKVMATTAGRFVNGATNHPYGSMATPNGSTKHLRDGIPWRNLGLSLPQEFSML